MTKVISLSDSAYITLKSIKEKDESFSDVVHKLFFRSKKRSLSDFFGRWPGTSEEADNIKKKLEFDRKKFRTNEVPL